MINSKRISVISIILIILAVGISIALWQYSFDYESDYEMYGGKKVVYTEYDQYTERNYKNAVHITGSKDKVKSTGGDVNSAKGTVYISAGGRYILTGEFSNIVIRSADDRPVMLSLNNAHIETAKEPPIYAYKASKLVLASEAGTENYIIDKRKKYSYQDANAAVYSVADITLNGEGTIHVEGNYQDGIKSERITKITSGYWDIISKDDGISSEEIYMRDGKVNVNSDGDAVKASAKNNDGIVVLKGGELISRGLKDGVYSTGDIYVCDANLDIFTGQGAENSSKRLTADAPSMKGLKADASICFLGGNIHLDTDDDAIHAAEGIEIDNGTFSLSSGDDAIHSDDYVKINGGTILINTCYEGIEGADIEINDGDIDIFAFDEGINVSGGSGEMMPPPPPDGMGGPGGAPPNMPPEMPRSNVADDDSLVTTFHMNGGDVYIESDGDGVDINGSGEMTGGRIVAFAKVDGPENALDFDDIFRMDGGTFAGAGNPTMVQFPSEKSKQNNLMIYPDKRYPNGGNIEIRDSLGNVVEQLITDGAFSWIGMYGENVRLGETYTAVIDGVEIGQATIEGVNTTMQCGDSAGMMPGGMGGPPPGGMNGNPPPKPPGDMGGGPPNGMGGPPPGGMNGEPPPKPPGDMGGPPNGMGGPAEANQQARNEASESDLMTNTIYVSSISLIGIILLIICMIIISKTKRRF